MKKATGKELCNPRYLLKWLNNGHWKTYLMFGLYWSRRYSYRILFKFAITVLLSFDTNTFTHHHEMLQSSQYINQVQLSPYWWRPVQEPNHSQQWPCSLLLHWAEYTFQSWGFSPVLLKIQIFQNFAGDHCLHVEGIQRIGRYCWNPWTKTKRRNVGTLKCLYPYTQPQGVTSQECVIVKHIAVPYWVIFMVFSLICLGVKVNSHRET